MKQVQVPRSTAESEVTAMAFSAQYVEGLKALFEDIFVSLDTPILWCDNRAAAHLTSSPGEWRTKALVNRVMGVRSLIELNVLLVRFKATLDMQADVLTKFMGGKYYPANVNWLAACHCDNVPEGAGPVCAAAQRAADASQATSAPRTPTRSMESRQQWQLPQLQPQPEELDPCLSVRRPWRRHRSRGIVLGSSCPPFVSLYFVSEDAGFRARPAPAADATCNVKVFEGSARKQYMGSVITRVLPT